MKALLITAVALLLLSACGEQSPRQIDETREGLASWTRSLELVEQQSRQHRVPDLYVRQMVNAAGKAVDRQRKRNRQAFSNAQVKAAADALTTAIARLHGSLGERRD